MAIYAVAENYIYIDGISFSNQIRELNNKYSSLSTSTSDDFINIREVNTFSSKILDAYRPLLETKEGKYVIQQILNIIESQKLSYDNLTRQMPTGECVENQLALWFLWRTQEVGIQIANSDISNFFNSNYIEELATLWVFGLSPNKTINISNGVDLRPISEMPASNEKYEYVRILNELNHESNTHVLKDNNNYVIVYPYEQSTPHAALVSTIRLPKIKNTKQSYDLGVVYDHISVKLRSYALIMNLIDNVICSQGASKHCVKECTPFGPLTHMGSSLAVDRITAPQVRHVTESDFSLITRCFDNYWNHSIESREVLDTAIAYVRSAKRFWRSQRSYLDLSIALEMIFFSCGKGSKEDRIAVNGSKLIGSNKEERNRLNKEIRLLYKLGSQVRHYGRLTDENLKNRDRNGQLPDFIDITLKIMREIVARPNWRDDI